MWLSSPSSGRWVPLRTGSFEIVAVVLYDFLSRRCRACGAVRSAEASESRNVFSFGGFLSVRIVRPTRRSLSELDLTLNLNIAGSLRSAAKTGRADDVSARLWPT